MTGAKAIELNSAQRRWEKIDNRKTTKKHTEIEERMKERVITIRFICARTRAEHNAAICSSTYSAEAYT